MPVHALDDNVPDIHPDAEVRPDALGVPARIRPVDTGGQKQWVDLAVREYRDAATHYRSTLRRIDQGEQR